MIRIALVGVGKIARDQHLPAIAATADFDLVATASPHDRLTGVPSFPSLDALLASGMAIDAVALCTPPGVRHGLATMALDAGLHVLLEKPPAATLSQLDDLVGRAGARRRTLFAAWHSREAAGVADARAWLNGQQIDAVRVDWREDIHRWHPGQDWILDSGAPGVFDPGINALSILTTILPDPLVLLAASLDVPADKGAPIAARLRLTSGDAPVDMSLDFRERGPQCWAIEIDTAAGVVRIDEGGRRLRLPDGAARRGEDREYVGLYRRFAALVASGASEVDKAPLKLVADAFLIGTRTTVGEIGDV